jgi:uncharacterized protein YjbJ (UPF0337 family)
MQQLVAGINQGTTHMNWAQIETDWKEVSEQIKRTWGKLSEDDLAAISGQRGRLSGLLQKRYGYAKEDAENKVDQFARRLPPECAAQNAIGRNHSK